VTRAQQSVVPQATAVQQFRTVAVREEAATTRSATAAERRSAPGITLRGAATQLATGDVQVPAHRSRSQTRPTKISSGFARLLLVPPDFTSGSTRPPNKCTYNDHSYCLHTTFNYGYNIDDGHQNNATK